MTPITLSMRPVAISVQESVQNDLIKSLPQMVYQIPQRNVQKTMPNVKPAPQVVYPRKTAQNNLVSMQKVKPVVSEVVHSQRTTLQNDKVAHAADEYTQVYNCRLESGHYDTFTCLGVYVHCVAV